MSGPGGVSGSGQGSGFERGPGSGRALFEFVRHWSRRAPADVRGSERGRLVLVTEAVHSLLRRGAPATVNAVAEEIGIDQSGASRLVKEATTAGCLITRASEADGRRREAAVTPAGHALLEQAHDWQDQVFERLTEGWSGRRRADFLEAMADLVDRSRELEM